MLHLALLVDLFGSKDEKFCSKRILRINFEKVKAQKIPSDDYVTSRLPEQLGQKMRRRRNMRNWKIFMKGVHARVRDISDKS